MDEWVIKTRQLQKKYGSKLAVSDLSIDVLSNSITGLIGRNGSGKTTFMKMVAGQLDKTSGEMKVFSQDSLDNLHTLKQLVYIYPNYQYVKGVKLKTILCDYNEMFATFDKEFAIKLLNYFELKSTMKYDQLSQGMASVFNFICGLSCRSKLTMFDEPVLGMDVTVRKAVYEVLLRDYTEYPRTIIISSHLISELEGVLSDIVLIEDGKLVLHDSTDNIRQSAYRVDATKDKLYVFCKGKNVIFTKMEDINSYAIVYEPITNEILNAAKEQSVEISAVRTEDLFVYLTRQNKEDELQCLWLKENLITPYY